MLIDEEAGDDVVVVAFMGPSGGGKQTLLRMLHRRADARGEVVRGFEVLENERETVVEFECRPTAAAPLRPGSGVRLFLRALTGPVFYRSSYDEILQYADAVVFIAGASPEDLELAGEQMMLLSKELAEASAPIPVVFVCNQRDTPDAVTVETLREMLDVGEAPCIETVAIADEGVAELEQLIAGHVLDAVRRRVSLEASVESARETIMQPIDQLGDELARVMSGAGSLPEPSRLLAAAEKAFAQERWGLAVENCRKVLSGGFGRVEAWLMLLDAASREGLTPAQLRPDRTAAATELLERAPHELPAEDWARLLQHLEHDDELSALCERARKRKAASEASGDFF